MYIKERKNNLIGYQDNSGARTLNFEKAPLCFEKESAKPDC